MGDPENAVQFFKWPDYVMLVFLLLVSLAIGAYFGHFRGVATMEEYLMGNRKMKLFPITMSLIASFVSGITILGIPADTYLYGIHYVYSLIGLVITAIFMNYIYLPVFYELKLTSTFEYFEKRFDRKVRVLGSILFGINLMTWLAMLVYICALTVNQVTGLNVHLVTPIICTICVAYTSWGGINAVVWTDVIQSIIMLLSLIIITVKGTIDVGGFNTVIERNLESGRIEGPSLDLNPSSRYTLWSLTMGISVYFLLVACLDQPMLQRYLALPSLKTAKKAVWSFVLGYAIFVVLCCYCGLLLYATFYKCDPLQTKLIQKTDQMMPLFVMRLLKPYPGLSGIFVAGILSATLSSLSTGLNSMSAVIIKDLHNIYLSKPLSNKKCFIIMKLTVFVFGLICVCLVYLIEPLGALPQVYMSVGAVTSGAILGLFTAGVLFPWINTKGALVGGTLSLAFIAWLCAESQIAILSGDLTYTRKPVTIECEFNFVNNGTEQSSSTFHPKEKSFKLYHISYLWYSWIGVFIVVTTGLLVSFVSRSPNKVEANLLSPILRKHAKNERSSDDDATDKLTSVPDQQESCN